MRDLRNFSPRVPTDGTLYRVPKRRNNALTPREAQIVVELTKALPNKAIAHNLGLTEGTVKEYLNRIFKKLNMNNRTEVALWAAQVM